MSRAAVLMPPDDEWLSVWDASLRAGVSFSRMSHALIDGELPVALLDGRDRVHVRAVDQWASRIGKRTH